MPGNSRKWGPEIEHLDKGLVRYALGKREEAIELWHKALELNPKSRRAVDFLQSVGALPAGDPDASAVTGQNPSVKVAATGDSPPVEGAAQSLVPPFAGSVSISDAEIEAGDSVVIDDIDILMENAEKEESAGNHEKALSHVEDVLRRDADHTAAATLAKKLRKELIGWRFQISDRTLHF